MVSPSVCGTEHISSILIILPSLSSRGGIGIHNGLIVYGKSMDMRVVKSETIW